MRLIDADRLKKVIDKNFYGTGGASVMMQLIDEQPTIEIPHWIPCSERPPETGKTVLVTVEADDGDAWTNTDTFYQGSWMRYCGEGRKVTAWQELPEPYGGDSE